MEIDLRSSSEKGELFWFRCDIIGEKGAVLSMGSSGKMPFSKLYEPIADVKGYLARIGYEGEVEVSKEGLSELMRCQLAAVPFENLDIFHGHREPSLETEALFGKIVTERRGGYCFELNGLFYKLLETLGFCCYCAAARIVLGREYRTPTAHRIIIVSLEGKRYFCDVGFGGPTPTVPILLEEGVVSASPSGYCHRFIKNGAETILEVELDGKFTPMMIFEEKACDEIDFIPFNAFCAFSEYEPFIKKQMLWKNLSDGKCSIDGNVLRVKRSGEEWEEVLDSEEKLRSALMTWFGIEYKGELREWRSGK